MLFFMLGFLDLVEAAETLTFLSRGGLLDSLLPYAVCDLEGPRDDERSLWCLGGSSSALSISVPGSSCPLDLEDDMCLPDSVSLATNFSSKTPWSTS